MRRLASLLGIVAGLTIALAGCSSSETGPSTGSAAQTPVSTAPTSSKPAAARPPRGTAVDAFKKWVGEYSDGQYDLMWDSLELRQQKIVSESKFMSCRAQLVSEAGINSLSYDQTVTSYKSKVEVPGTSVAVNSTAITAKVSANGSNRTTITAHWFVEAGAWRWSLDQASVTAYQAHRCPSS